MQNPSNLVRLFGSRIASELSFHDALEARVREAEAIWEWRLEFAITPAEHRAKREAHAELVQAERLLDRYVAGCGRPRPITLRDRNTERAIAEAGAEAFDEGYDPRMVSELFDEEPFAPVR